MGVKKREKNAKAANMGRILEITLLFQTSFLKTSQRVANTHDTRLDGQGKDVEAVGKPTGDG
jgi:hypothetical protein